MKNKSFLLTECKQMNRGAMISGVGFLLYLAASALISEEIALVLSIVFGLFSLYVFVSTLSARGKDRESVSYSLMWGTGALTLLMLGPAVLTIKMNLGL